MNNIPDGYTALNGSLRSVAQCAGFPPAVLAARSSRLRSSSVQPAHAPSLSLTRWVIRKRTWRVVDFVAATTFARALAAGAEAVTRPTELFWGDLVGRARDPIGNLWRIQQRVAELTPEEMAERAQRPEFIDAMRYVQSAELVGP